MVNQHLQRIYKATSIICQIRVVPLKWSLKLPFIVHITRQERAAFRNLGIWYCPFSQTTYWTCRFCFFLCILVSQLRFLSPPAAPSPRTFQSSHIFFQLWQRGSCSTGEIHPCLPAHWRSKSSRESQKSRGRSVSELWTGNILLADKYICSKASWIYELPSGLLVNHRQTVCADPT